jgi:hypothetical protein
LHGHHGSAAQVAKHQLVGMALHVRQREARNIGIGDRHRLANPGREAAQARAEDQADVGLKDAALADGGSGFAYRTASA